MKIKKYSLLKASKSGIITLGGEVLGPTKLQKLAGEIVTLKSLEIWEILQETVKQEAIEMGFVQSKTMEELIAGKMLAYAVESIDTLCSKIIAASKKV